MRKGFTLNSSQPRKSKKTVDRRNHEFALENAYWSVSEVLYCTTLFSLPRHPQADSDKMPDISHILADRSRTLLFFKKKCLKSADHPLLRVFYFSLSFSAHSYTPFASVTHLLNPGTDISPELCYILPIFQNTPRCTIFFIVRREFCPSLPSLTDHFISRQNCEKKRHLPSSQR